MKQKHHHVVNETSVKRRTVLKSVGLSGVGLSMLPTSWTKPVVNSVLLPAHAQMSTCPELTTRAVSHSPGSNTATCGISFEVLSATAVPVNVLSISNSAPVDVLDVPSYPDGTSGSIDDSNGLRIDWVGVSVGGAFACTATTPPVPVNEMVFTVTYNCDADSTTQTQQFSLQAIANDL